MTAGSSSLSHTSNPPTQPGLIFLYRVLVWSAAFGVLYTLRSFFLLIFLTFIFSYIQANAVEKLAPRIRNRTVRVIMVFVTLLGFIVAVGNFVAPRVQAQAETFARRYPQYLQTLDTSIIAASHDYQIIQRIFPQVTEMELAAGTSWRYETSVSVQIIKDMLGVSSTATTHTKIGQMVERLRDIFSRILASISAFLLSLLFSFLIVLDLPRLASGARSLRDTKLEFIYDEVAPTIVSFARVMGRAFEAQMVVAFLNTLLTAIGIYLLGIGENIAFFSVIVFLCSFIPVAGVFISSVPMCLLALQESGFTLMFLTIVLITVIHVVETYILNPKIYGHHLRMNPVLVLIILTVGGKLFHIWGLILGVPICTYIFGHAIWGDKQLLSHGESTSVPGSQH